ncbi:MAG: HNH endonuclease, partial [Micrococcaceae bacterium]|nr:HNH endonuclease [Micrococcaceae bacterium]
MANDGARRLRAARRRKRRMSRVDNDLTETQWSALKDAWVGCAYCGSDETTLQRDCVQPISRGGRYTLENVVPACGTCNASKGSREVTSWMRRRALDERAFLARYFTIQRVLSRTLALDAGTTAVP